MEKELQPPKGDFKLPTINELISMELTEREKGNALNVLLNQTPPPQWLKKQNGVLHLPIDKVRYLLSKIYVDWSETIKNVIMVANSIVVTITLNYTCPLTGKEKQMDGIGGAPVNTQKGASAVDFDKILHDSIHKAVGSAASFALKNAAKKLGRIFGSDLMKDDVIPYDSLIDPEKFKDAKITEK